MILFVYILILLFAVIPTIVIELGVVYFFGLRKKKEILTVVGINAITNPTMNYILLVDQFLTGDKSGTILVFLLEVLVVLVEWKLLVYFLGGDSKKMLFISFIMNLVSCLLGILIFS